MSVQATVMHAKGLSPLEGFVLEAPPEAALEILASLPGEAGERLALLGATAPGLLQQEAQNPPQAASVLPHLCRCIEVQAVIEVDELVVGGGCLRLQAFISGRAPGLRESAGGLPRPPLSDEELRVRLAQGRSGLVLELSLLQLLFVAHVSLPETFRVRLVGFLKAFRVRLVGFLEALIHASSVAPHNQSSDDADEDCGEEHVQEPRPHRLPEIELSEYHQT